MFCNYANGISGCLQPDGGFVPGLTGNPVRHAPLPAPGQPLTGIFERGAMPSREWVSRNLVTGQTRPIQRPPNDHARGPIPIDEETAVWMDTQNNLWRVSPNAPPFAVLDMTRTACPMLSTEAEAASCGLVPELEYPGIQYSVPLGFDPTRRMVVFHVMTNTEMFLFGVGKTVARRLEDVTTTADGYPIEWLYPMAPFGAAGFVAVASGTDDTGDGIVQGAFRLDDRFRRVPSKQPFIAGRSNVNFFRGYALLFTEYFLGEPLTVGPTCMSLGPVTFCDLAPPYTPGYGPRPIWGELVPVRAPLEPGEVLFWSPRQEIEAYRLQGNWDPHSSTYRSPNEPRWQLWRYTRLSAAVPWLNGDEFTALMAAPDRALLSTVPLGQVTSLNVSPDGRKVCVAEKSVGRVWELALDAGRLPASVRLAAASNAAGCAYDETGALGVLEANPVAVATNGGRHPVTGVSTPHALHRLGGRWLVQAVEEPAVCVRDDGSSQRSNVTLVALSWAPGGLAYIDDAELARTNTVDGFCAGTLFSEALLKDDVPIWAVAFSRFSMRTNHAKTGVLAVRPDGFALLATEKVISNYLLPPTVVLAMFPDYWPRPPLRGLPEHDDFRRAGLTLNEDTYRQLKLASFYPRDVTAMTLVPGASKADDWGYLKRPGIPPAPSPDAGTTTEEPPPPGMTPPKGCGCSQTDVAILCLAILGLCRRGRRAD